MATTTKKQTYAYVLKINGELNKHYIFKTQNQAQKKASLLIIWGAIHIETMEVVRMTNKNGFTNFFNNNNHNK